GREADVRLRPGGAGAGAGAARAARGPGAHGRGRFDRQTSMGKGPVALARLARAQGTHVVLFAGIVQRDNGPELSLFREVVELSSQARPGASARETLREATAKWALARLGR
ncbi:glycerate kinase, partial [Corallococcus sp. 4LFB]|uniref:glycerate kinase n=1 Tax=Corallococcus sp. 4LFB TaxID=3383249 RepID=UPI0039754FA5